MTSLLATTHSNHCIIPLRHHLVCAYPFCIFFCDEKWTQANRYFKLPWLVSFKKKKERKKCFEMTLFPHKQLAKGNGWTREWIISIFICLCFFLRERGEWAENGGRVASAASRSLASCFSESDGQNAYIRLLEGSSCWQQPNVILGVFRLLFLVVTLILYLHFPAWLSLLKLAF